MSLSDLTARELARIDEVCLAYESSLREGSEQDIDQIVQQHGGANADELRRELVAIRDELADQARTPGTTTHTDLSTSFLGGATPKPGTVIGPYVVGDLLGRGGMGIVVEATDQRLGRRVAIKMLAGQANLHQELTDRFDREARAVAAISHPNIVELFDVGTFDGLPYAVMEYLDGELLSERLDRGSMTAGEVRLIGAQIADALATAHQRKVIHRDLKPHNVMLVRRAGGAIPDTTGDSTTAQPSRMASVDESSVPSDSAIVKLFDFGLSRAPRPMLGHVLASTQDGIIMGTPGYMAPEQALGETVSGAADLFSLGCILFEAFYGHQAFDGPTKVQRHHATLNRHPETDPARRRDDPALAELIDQCLKKQPSERPASAALVAQQLRTRATSSQADAKILTRRRALELACGAAAGAGIGAWIPLRFAPPSRRIDSLGVLSFVGPSGQDAEPTPVDGLPAPIGQGVLAPGDQLAAMLAMELSKLEDVNVPMFRPLIVTSPDGLRRFGERLGVDALLTGRIDKVQGEGGRDTYRISAEILSTESLKVIWSDEFETDSLGALAETRLAGRIAEAIGRRLTPAADQLEPPSPGSFACLVDGKTRLDPDSRQGLEMALDCFHDAQSQDASFLDPVAGIALASITLAGQTDGERTAELLNDARENSRYVLQRDPMSVDARLAEAMLMWQTLAEYDQANQILRNLQTESPNNWQVWHQYGLMKLTMRDFDVAGDALRKAVVLNPLSLALKIDRARGYWFSGAGSRAIDDARLLLDRYDYGLARGLLIDIYEYQGDYRRALELDDDGTDVASDASSYYDWRSTRLAARPYGPFGETVNHAILLARTSGIDSIGLSQLMDPLVPPMFPLVLGAHPSFVEVRTLPQAVEVLPKTQ